MTIDYSNNESNITDLDAFFSFFFTLLPLNVDEITRP
jgi:hypothetical protein